jgi:hypothetical protein
MLDWVSRLTEEPDSANRLLTLGRGYGLSRRGQNAADARGSQILQAKLRNIKVLGSRLGGESLERDAKIGHTP